MPISKWQAQLQDPYGCFCASAKHLGKEAALTSMALRQSSSASAKDARTGERLYANGFALVLWCLCRVSENSRASRSLCVSIWQICRCICACAYTVLAVVPSLFKPSAWLSTNVKTLQTLTVSAITLSGFRRSAWPSSCVNTIAYQLLD